MKTLYTAVLLLLCIAMFSANALSAITSTATGGNWSATGTWSGGVVPTTTDDVIIADGATVTINASPTVASLTVGQGNSGTLIFDGVAARAVIVTGNVTVAANGTFIVQSSGTFTNTLTVGGDLTNNGIFDMSRGGTTLLCNVTFNKNGNQAVSGTGGTTRFNLITLNMGTSNANILEVSSSNFAAAAGFLTLTGGTFKMSGSFTFTNIFFTGTGWAIGASGVNTQQGLWINNPNVTVTAQNGSPTVYGLLRLTAGTFNVGTGSGNSLKYNGATIIIEGGSLNISGRFSETSGSSQKCTYTQSGGTVKACTVGNGSSSLAGFDIQSTSSSFTMSAGTIIVQVMNSAAGGDYINLAGTYNVTGGTIQLGNASTAASSTFLVNSSAPVYNFVVSGATSNTPKPVAQLVTNNLTVLGNLTIESGTTLNANSKNISVGGNWSNSGTFTNTGSTVTFNGTGAQSITKSGGESFNILAVNKTSGTLSLNNDVTVAGTTTVTSGTLAVNTGTTLAVAGTLTNNGTVNVNGSFQMNTGSWATGTGLVYGSAGTLIFNTSSSYGVNGDAYWPASNGPVNVTVNSGGIGMTVDRAVTGVFQTGGPVTTGWHLNPLSGTNQINSGGSFDANPNYSGNATLIYNTSGPFTSSYEWISGSGGVGWGIPKNVTIQNSTAVTMATGDHYVAGNLSITSGSLTLNGGSGDLYVAGNWSRTAGTFSSNGRAVFFNGSADQSLTAAGGGTFDWLGINNSGGNLNLNNNITVNNTLWLTSGKIVTGSNTVTLGTSGSISGATSAKYIYGNLAYTVASSGSPTLGFEIGDATNYTPVQVALNTLNAGGVITAKTTAGQEPNVGSSTLSSSKYVNRYYTITNTTAGFTDYSATFNYVSGDLVGSPNTSNFAVGKYSSGSWTYPTVGTKTGTSTQITGVTTGFSDFAIAEMAPTYTLTANATNGTVTKSPDAANYAEGAIVTITAVPATGYHFVNWTGDHVGTTNPDTVLMSANKTVTANFAINTYTLTVNANPAQGSVGLVPSGGTYDSNTTVNLTATAMPGYHFVNWTGDHVGTVNPDTVLMSANKTVTANFAIDQFTITSSATNGTILPTPSATVNYGDNQQFTYSPTTGYHFDSVLVDGIKHTDSTVSYTFKNVQSAHSISVYYTINTYTVTILGGTVTLTPPGGSYTYGTLVNFTVPDSIGKHFDHWTGDLAGSGSTGSFTVDSNITATVHYVPLYSIITHATHGTVNVNPLGSYAGQYLSNTPVQLTAVADSAYEFTGWSGAVTGLTNPISVNTDSTIEVTANFAVAATFTLTPSVTGDGTITPATPQVVSPGANLKFTFAPNAHSKFDSLIVDDSKVDTATTSYLFENVAAAHSIHAYFSLIKYTITTHGTHGSIGLNPAGGTYDYHTSVEATATADEGYHFTGWTGAITGSTSPVSVYADSNMDITANFAINTYTLTLNSNPAMGTAAKSPDLGSYNHGDTVIITATPVAGYSFTGWTGDLVSSKNPDTVVVTANKTITANFTINTFAITTTVTGNGTITPVNPTPSYGSDQQFTIAPNTGSHFDSLLVDGIKVDTETTSYTFKNVTTTHSIHAYFSPYMYTITPTAVNGTVALNPLTGPYAYGSQVILTATPSTGYSFANWSGDISATANPDTIIITGNLNVTANFTINTYTLNVTAVNGTVALNPPTGPYNYGTWVTLTATPSSGYHFVNWTVGLTSSNNPDSILMTANKNVTANFAVNLAAFRSHQSGNWNDTLTWERNNGSGWVYPPSVVPSSSDSAITILNSHTVTVTASVAADQMTINAGGTVAVASGQTLTVANGADSIDAVVYGTLNNFGTVTATGRLSFENGGLYIHSVPGTAASLMPVSTFRTGSTCRIDSCGVTSSGSGSPSNLYTQTLYNLIWNVVNQGNNVSTPFADGTIIYGDLTVTNTKNSAYRYSVTSGAGSKTITINGNLNINGSAIFTGSGSSADASTLITIIVNGNVNVSAGTLSLQNSSNASAELKVKGNFTITGGTLLSGTSGTVDRRKLNFIGGTTQQFTVTSPGTIGTSKTTFVSSNGSTVQVNFPWTLMAGGALSLNGGTFVTTSTNYIVVPYDGTVSGGSATSFVNGPLTRMDTSKASLGLFFPVGKGTAYRPLTLNISQDASTSTAYTAEMFNAAPTSRTVPTGLLSVASGRYYTIKKGSGANISSNGASIQLSYDTDDNVSSATLLRIAQDSSTYWKNLGGSGTANTTGTISSNAFYSLNSSNDFVLATADTTTPVALATVSTTTISRISATFATGGGNISNDGGGAVTARGICWDTASSPTIANSKTIDGSGTGIFISSLTGLTPGTLYHVRAYATNSAGTSYGGDTTFSTLATLVPPTVTTTAVTNILTTTAQSGGNVTAWGGDSVTARGVCWSTSASPTTANTHSVDGSGLGTYISGIAPLIANTTYHVRAYATNGAGTGYGDDIQFTTQVPQNDTTVVVDWAGSGNYTTLQAAFNAVPVGYTGHYTIFVKNGTYVEKDTLTTGKINVILQGESRDNTIITHHWYADSLSVGTNGSFTMAIDASDFKAKDITIQNTYYPMPGVSGSQAVALRTQGDRHEFTNCKILGYQDTYYAWGGNGTGREYFKNCLIEGTVDFIFGRNIVVFDSCTIHERRGNGASLTAGATDASSLYGLTFRNCTIVADSIGYDGNPNTSWFLGRPWQGSPRTVFLNTVEPFNLNPAGWTTMSATPALYAESNCYGDGSGTSLRVNFSSQLTLSTAATYSLSNIFAKNSASSSLILYDWMPASSMSDQPLLLRITASASVNGLISSSGITPVVYGGSKSYTITPAPGYHVADVLVDGSSVGAQTTYNFTSVVGNRTIAATFAQNTSTITAAANGNGTISPSGAVVVVDGNSQQFTFAPNTGNHFDSLLVDGLKVDTATTSFTFTNVSGPHTIAAYFSLYTYSVTTHATGGTVTVNPPTGPYAYGSTVKFTATPAEGFDFTGWTGGLTSSHNPDSVVITGNLDVTANFASNTFALTVISVNGTVAKSPDQSSYPYHTLVHLTATPSTGYHFTGWSGAFTSAANPDSIYIDSVMSVTANYAINTYTMTLDTIGTGTVAKSPDKVSYNYGDTVIISATAGSGYHFVFWTDSLTSSRNPDTVIMNSNKVITAHFPQNLNASYRTHQTGVWSSTSTWEKNANDGSGWITPADHTPTWQDSTITILSGHIVTMDVVHDTVDQMTLNAGGKLIIPAADSLYINNGAGTDLMVKDSLICSGKLTLLNTPAVVFDSGSVYQHNIGSASDGGSLPIATWHSASTCLITGLTGKAPSNNAQTFGNFTWNCPGQTTDLNVTWGVAAPETIKGNLTVLSTGTPTAFQFRMSNSGILYPINILGNVNVSGTSLYYISGSAGAQPINIGGNVTISGGTWAINSNKTGIFTWNLKGDLSLSNCTVTRSSTNNDTKIVFAKGSGSQTYTRGSGVTFANAIRLGVASGSTLNMGTSTFDGTGSFKADAGATLVTSISTGLNGNLLNTGVDTLSTGANYVFNGSTAQVTGALMPATVNNLTISNPANVSLSAGTAVSGNLAFTSGKLRTAGNALSVAGSVTGANSGSYVFGTLARTIPTGAQSPSFDIGDTTNYTPVNVAFGNVTGQGTLTAMTFAGKHPSLSTSGIDTSKKVNRYYRLTNGGTTFDNYSATFNYAATDVDGGATPANFVVKKYDTGTWTLPTTGALTATSSQATGMTNFSDFAIGELNVTPTIVVTGALSNFGNVAVGTPSTEQTYTVSGTNLAGNIVVTAPTGFQVSTTTGSGFGSSVSLTPVSNTVSATTIYVRFNPVAVGAASGNITHTSSGATPQNEAVAGTGIDIPTVTTPTSSALATTSATLGGTVGTDNGASITASGVAYATTANPAAPGVTTASPVSSGAYTVNVSGLTANTLYHYRAYATNSVGTGYSSDATFTTLADAPVAVAATSVNNTSFVANWNAVSGSVAVSYHLDVSTDNLFGSFVSGYSDLDVSTATSHTVSGLTQNTTYYYRVRAVNAGGASANSNSITAVTTNILTPNNLSDVIATPSFTYPTNIPYISYPPAGSLTVGNSVGVFGLTVRDGGASAPDSDSTPTVLTALSLTGVNLSLIDHAALFSGSTNLGEVAVSGSTISFSGLTDTVADNGTKDLVLRVTFKTTVTDNMQFAFTVSSVTADPTLSGFAAANGGGATSSTAGSNNEVAVVATKINFTTQPQNGLRTGENIGPVSIAAQDANDNVDVDFADSVSLSSSSFTLASTDVGGLKALPASGVATWANLSSSNAATGTITGTASGLPIATSNSIAVYKNIITVTSDTTGSWYSASTWKDGILPGTNDSVIIRSVDSVYYTSASVHDTCGSLTVLNGGRFTTTTSTDSSLVVTRVLTLEPHAWYFNNSSTGALPGSTRIIDTASTVVFRSSNVGGTGNLEFGHVIIERSTGSVPAGNLIIHGNLTINNSGNGVTFRGANASMGVRNHIVHGNVYVNKGQWVSVDVGSDSTACTWNVDGDVIVHPTTIGDARIGSFASANAKGIGTMNIHGKLDIDGGRLQAGTGSSTPTLGTSIFNLGGDFKMLHGWTTTNSTGPVIFNFVGTGTQTVTLDSNFSFSTNVFDTIAATSSVIFHLGDKMWRSTTGGAFVVNGSFAIDTCKIKGVQAFTVNPGATFKMGSPYGISAAVLPGDTLGNIMTSGIRTFSPAANYGYIGVSSQVTGSGLPSQVNGLLVDNTHGVTLSGPDTVNGLLNLVNGKLTTSGNKLYIGSTGSTSRTNGYVVGDLERYIATGATAATYDIGDPSHYTPVTVSFGNVTGAGNLKAATVDTAHPQIASSGIIPTKSVHRYFTLTNTGIGFNNYSAVFNYAASDVDTATNPLDFVVKKYDGGVWTAPTMGSLTSTSAQITGATSFSDFVMGTPVPLDSFTLNVGVVGNGNVTKAPDQVKYQTGTPVVLTALPATGWHFIHWLGDITGTVNPVTIPVYANMNVVAVFGIDTIKITAIAGSNGSILPSDSAKVEYGSDQRFTFAPATGYHVDSVFVDGTLNADSTSAYTFKHVTATHVIRVVFKINSYTITVTADTNGTVTPGTTGVTHGSNQRFVFTPKTGYRVDSVFADGASVPDSIHGYTFKNVTGAHTLRVMFNISSYTITVTSGLHGTVVPGTSIINYGTNQRFAFVPNTGYQVDTVRVDGTLVPDSTTGYTFINVTASHSLSVNFALEAAYAAKYRTITYESLYVKKAVAKKNVTEYWEFNIQNTTGASISEMTIYLKNDAKTILGSGSMTALGSKKLWTLTGTLANGQSITFKGRSPKASTQVITKLFLGPVTKTPTAKNVAANISIHELPMPNAASVREDVFKRGGFPTGLLIGYPQTDKDSMKAYGWVLMKKSSNMLSSLYDKNGYHTQVHPGGFNVFTAGKAFVKGLASLPPTKQNNKTFADLLALKFNIAMSLLGTTQRGFGELRYVESGSPFNGMLLRDIATRGDSMMTYWNRFTAAPQLYGKLDSVLTKINSAFSGVIDTTSWSDTLKLKGTKSLVDVDFLRASGIAPAAITPTHMDEAMNEEPTVAKLYQNYPNPFNPTTTIEFDLPNASIVTIKVYNILGQEVASLFDHEEFTNGHQQVQFVANNLASGVYFYRIIADGIAGDDGTIVSTFTSTKKMVVVK
jgi:uncharacterized repeat protein (TIGR02543 family)